jgi:hypothetical protein
MEMVDIVITYLKSSDARMIESALWFCSNLSATSF